MIRKWKNREKVQELWGYPFGQCVKVNKPRKTDNLKNEKPQKSGMELRLYLPGNLQARTICQQRSKVIRAKD